MRERLIKYNLQVIVNERFGNDYLMIKDKNKDQGINEDVYKDEDIDQDMVKEDLDNLSQHRSKLILYYTVRIRILNIPNRIIWKWRITLQNISDNLFILHFVMPSLHKRVVEPVRNCRFFFHSSLMQRTLKPASL